MGNIRSPAGDYSPARRRRLLSEGQIIPASKQEPRQRKLPEPQKSSGPWASRISARAQTYFYLFPNSCNADGSLSNLRNGRPRWAALLPSWGRERRCAQIAGGISS